MICKFADYCNENFDKIELTSDEELAQSDDIKFWKQSLNKEADKRLIKMLNQHFEKHGFKINLKAIARDNSGVPDHNYSINNTYEMICPNPEYSFTFEFSKSGCTIYFGNIEKLVDTAEYEARYGKDKLFSITNKGYQTVTRMVAAVKKLNPYALRPKLKGPSMVGVI